MFATCPSRMSRLSLFSTFEYQIPATSLRQCALLIDTLSICAPCVLQRSFATNGRETRITERIIPSAISSVECLNTARMISVRDIRGDFGSFTALRRF